MTEEAKEFCELPAAARRKGQIVHLRLDAIEPRHPAAYIDLRAKLEPPPANVERGCVVRYLPECSLYLAPQSVESPTFGGNRLELASGNRLLELA